MSKKINKEALAPMPWRDFVLAFQVASEALDNPRLDQIEPVDPADPNSVKLREAKLKIQSDPFLRVLWSVQEQFGEGYEHMAPFTYRFWALLHLMKKGHLRDWITEDEERSFHSFHPAVLLAAAEAKLNDKARFPPKRFLETAIRIRDEETTGDTDA